LEYLFTSPVKGMLRQGVDVFDVDGLLGDPGALEARIRASLTRGGHAPRSLPPGIRRAGVLLLVVHCAGGAALLFEKRSRTVERHKGQISLPGGAVEPGESPLQAALRETWEEIGVRPGDVAVLGQLADEEAVVSGFALTPFVGTIPYPYALEVSRAEVEAVLEVPLGVLLDPRNVRTETWDRGGTFKLVHFYSIGPEVIWGATGRVIAQFLQAVFGVPIPDGAGGHLVRPV
jgi:8-oxo-dGTP pyrophosphatase MutT (NUDIX family)